MLYSVLLSGLAPLGRFCGLTLGLPVHHLGCADGVNREGEGGRGSEKVGYISPGSDSHRPGQLFLPC